MLLSTLGSLGDLYPVLSVAKALDAQGIEARLALSPDDAKVAESWGLPATAIGPSQAEVCERLGVTIDDIAASVLRDPRPLLRDVLLPMLPALIAEFRILARGARAVAGTPFALGAALVAQEARLPFVPLILQPFMALSELDPPHKAWTGLAAADPGTGQHVWNRLVLGVIRWLFRQSLGPAYNALRSDLGLPPHPGAPLLDPDGDPSLRIGLWDHHFAPQAPDSDVQPVGFPPSPPGTLAPEHLQWIDQGEPPLVITLGSIAQNLGGARFWSEAVALTRGMGLRAVLLHGQAKVPEGTDLLPLPYAPHAALFPRAAAILHHGGIGTTAEALRSGRPQLVVPVGGDQPDNAARLRSLGVATTLPLKSFTAKRAQALLAPLLDRFDYPAAGALADHIRKTDGASEAANQIAALISQDCDDRR